MTPYPDPDPGSSSANYNLLDRLADEFAERFRRGERPSLKEYTDRYPELAEEIQMLFPALVDLEQADAVRQEKAEDRSGAGPRPRAPALEQIGDYRVLREIGRGGMGVVYEAEQVSLGRRVALKILPQQVARHPKMLERFRREARAAARLHHTNIVPVFEVGREADVCYYAMQFIQGQGLDLVYDELRRRRGLAKEPSETGARPGAEGTATHAGRAAIAQVVHSLLTGRFEDDALPEPASTAAGPSGPETATGMFAPGTEPNPASALARTVADAAAGDLENVPAPTPPGLEHPPLPAPAPAPAVMPGGSQISTIESGRRDYARCIAWIGLQAAQGLAYAHARGVVHRDIKPSNLLLDTAGVVWITDFGLAKAEGEGLTQTGDVLGTLRYMAPERFSGGGDAQADVYALGVTLYELLTLEPAFDAPDRLRLIEQIKSVEPVRPRLVDRRLPRDLETVILKAIDKDARRRYQTADALAEDLRRFRDDEPILARRATAVERTARWARRNPGVAVLGGVLTVVLVLATVASLVVAGQMAALANRQRMAADSERVARLAERNARQHEAALRKQAEVERNRAEENFQRARAVVDQYFTQVSESQLLSVPGLQTLRRDLLGSALSFYEDYLARRGRDPGLRSALAAVHLKAAKIHQELGDRVAAEKDYRSALALYEVLAQADPGPDARSGLAECHYGLAMCGAAGDPRRDALLRSATIRQALVAARPKDTRLREDLARSYQALGESQLAAVVAASAQAPSLQAARSVTEALDWFVKARDLAASLVKDHPDDPAYRHDFAENLGQIAECLCKLGRHQDETIIRPMAIDHARAAYEQAPHQVAYGRLYGHLATRQGNNLSSQKRYDESLRSLWQALQVQEKLIRENPAVPDLPRALFPTYHYVLHVGTDMGDPSDLVPRLRQSCDLLEALPVRGPDQLFVLTQLLALRSTRPEPSRPRDEDDARRRRDLDAAADALRRAIAGGLSDANDINTLRSNARLDFPSLLSRPDVAGMLTELDARRKAGGLVAQKPNPAPGSTPNPIVPAARPVSTTQDAEAAHRRLQADLAASEHAIALVRYAMGTTHQKLGDLAVAVTSLHEASERFQALRTARPYDQVLAREHGVILRFLAVTLRDSQRPTEALARAGEALAVDESLRDPIPGDLYKLARDCALVAALLDPGATEDRDNLAERALGYLRRAIEGDPDHLLPQIPADHDLDPLRDRADFRELMADATFPRDPFAPASTAVLPSKPIINSIGMKLVLIPAGEFAMGSPATDKDAQDVERPQHRVRITRPFYLGATEVTVGQFRRVVEKAGYRTEGEHDGKGAGGWNAASGILERVPRYTWRNPGFAQTDEHPVVNVTWNDAVAFCKLLSEMEGLKGSDGYRLPTEAEWEYACRAGTTSRYQSGDDPETLALVGNIGDGTLKARYPNWGYATIAARDDAIHTAPVGRFRPNAFHLYDMHGNVYEWCLDGFANDYYGRSPAADPAGPVGASSHVYRGGAWHSRPASARSANRFWSDSENRTDAVGFRVVRVQSVPSQPPPMVAAAPPAPTRTERVGGPGSDGKSIGQVEPLKPITNSIGMNLVLIPAGEFMMGSPAADKDGQDIERPQHRVRITRPFYLGATEVTVGQFRRVVETAGYRTEAEIDGKGGIGWNVAKGTHERGPQYTWRNPGFAQTDEHPVVNVSWNDAIAYCKLLTEMEGLKPNDGYRLPTEAEWEYACRAGTTSRYQSGDDAETLALVGNIADGTFKAQYPDRKTETIAARDGFINTAPVGQFRPNAFGLYDIHGNVHELCQAGFDKVYDSGHSPAADPPGPPRASALVSRGGGWISYPQYARSAYRRLMTSTLKGHDLGFRLVRVQSVPPQPPPLVAAAPPAPTRTEKAGGAGSDGKSIEQVEPLKPITNTIGMNLVLIPAGEFMMGSPATDKDAQDVERPQHRVRITRPFYLGATEVTVGQFRRVVEASGYRTEAETDGKGGLGWNEANGTNERGPQYTWRNPGFAQTDDHPVVNVSWNDAIAYCKFLTEMEGLKPNDGYRLPTEAEWEYACRAGTTSRYGFGDDPEMLALVGNVGDGTFRARYPNWDFATIAARDGTINTAPVGRFRPNAFKLYDMHGNVYEWCLDGYDKNYYGQSPGADPPGPLQASARVVRGGAWHSRGTSARSANRTSAPPEDRHTGRGFRVARVQSRSNEVLTTDRSPEVAGRLRSDSTGTIPASSTPATPLEKDVNPQAEAAKTRAALIGQKAAPLAVSAWVNGSPVSDLELKGKVVLLDFWAVWCGPCIATFPHLREWNEKYASKGLVMIGLTDYFNFAWDEQAGKATRSADEVAPEQEQAMLVKFAAGHKLTHRLGIQKEHALSKYYGVTGIPQVVVIDRDGVIRLIKVGSGEAGAREIGELLETLLAPGGEDEPNDNKGSR
jgi:serine/threonine-protein kinase